MQGELVDEVFSRMGLVSVGSGSLAVVYCSGVSVLKVYASDVEFSRL